MKSYIFQEEGGIRLDSAIIVDINSSLLCSMLAKLIAFGDSREEAITIMKRALGEFGIVGVKTNIDFQYSLLEMDKVIEGDYDTSFLNEVMVKNNV